MLVVLIAIDGAGTYFFNHKLGCPFFHEFISKGSFHFVKAVVPTDSAENWGSILTGVLPEKHNLKLETLHIEYANKEYPSLFKLILEKFTHYKLAAFTAWDKILTGMVEYSLPIVKYSPILNESIFTKLYISINHHFFKNPIYDYYIVQQVINYIKVTDKLNFLLIHFVDLDEIAHIYGFGSDAYVKRLHLTDEYIKSIVENLPDKDNSLILITTDHGGIGTKHGGESPAETNVFIASNQDLNKYHENINCNMSCASIILKYLNIDIPNYFNN